MSVKYCPEFQGVLCAYLVSSKLLLDCFKPYSCIIVSADYSGPDGAVCFLPGPEEICLSNLKMFKSTKKKT